MPPAAQIAWVLAFAALLAVIATRGDWSWFAAPIGAGDLHGPGVPDDGGDDEQQPETDRAPRLGVHALTCAVALTAVVRLGLFVALHR
ncbi:MAG: hypothetical protein ACJ79H_09525 [Myxococcales bacterium]